MLDRQLQQPRSRQLIACQTNLEVKLWHEITSPEQAVLWDSALELHRSRWTFVWFWREVARDSLCVHQPCCNLEICFSVISLAILIIIFKVTRRFFAIIDDKVGRPALSVDSWVVMDFYTGHVSAEPLVALRDRVLLKTFELLFQFFVVVDFSARQRRVELCVLIEFPRLWVKCSMSHC